MTQPLREPVLAAIDVGTNAVRLELARQAPGGELEILHQERDPIRPGEGVFKTGAIPKTTADRLLATLRRYGALCRLYRAQVRAVATSAVREAKNRDEIVQRVREEAGLRLEVVSGMEEARLICLGVLQGHAPFARALCIDIGGGSTEVASAVGERPLQLWSVGLGAVRLTELFDTAGKVSPKQLKLLQGYAREAIAEALPSRIPQAPKRAFGSSGTINAVVAFASEGGSQANAGELAKAAKELAEMSPDKRRKRFDAKRAEIIVAGAVILDTFVRHLGLESVVGVQRGLREGILVDLIRRQTFNPEDHSLEDAALEIGRRFHFDEKHSKHVAKLALMLFDSIATEEGLPIEARPLLGVAALLHDIGNAVSYQRHHKHTYYLIANADIPGLSERERELVARIARYHRRSTPEGKHSGLLGLSADEGRLVRQLATLLRLADSLDRSHRQPVQDVAVARDRKGARLSLRAKGPLDLELWDLEHESELYHRVFGQKLEPKVRPQR
jgi:exopolyphosphatase/guanosine-5'-triphosphate,3'-diphosphate pyrophosphatase